MPVTNKPFESEFGFKSPGFSVNSLGQITANSIVLSAPTEETSSGIELGNFTFVNNSIVNTTQNLTEILYGIATNEIDSIGNSLSITAPKVNFSGPVKLASLTTTQRDTLTPEDGFIIFNSTTDKLELYNGNWVSFPNVGNFQFTGNAITSTVSGNITITPSTGDFLVTTNFAAPNITAVSITTDSVTLNDEPATPADAANKGYVDRISAALAIALGS